MTDFVFKTTPFAHQFDAINQSFDRLNFAYLMEQGTGKSKVIIDRVANMFLQRKVDRLLVVAPNGVHANWLNEQIPNHLPESIKFSGAIHRSGLGKKAKLQIQSLIAPASASEEIVLRILCINIEAFVSKDVEHMAVKFLRGASINSFVALDESSTIKHPGAGRTKALRRIGAYSKYKAILTGTVVTQSPLDFYSQFQFLSPNILGCKNYSIFKNRYAEWTERTIERNGQRRTFQELKRYKNLDELKNKVAANSYQVQKKDCLDLPEQMYETRPVVLGAVQRSAYNQVRSRVLAEFEHGELTTPNALTRLTRLSQIAGGFLPLDNEECRELPNAKLKALEDIIEEIPEQAQVIIWARFKPELNAIVNLIGEDKCAKYWGEIDRKDRAIQADEFKTGQRRFMVAQPAAGGKGHTWIAGTYVIYFSNSFSYEDRKQSEDRAHRIGQNEKVTYIDLIAEDTVDEKIIDALRDKKDMADFFKESSLRDLL